MCGIFSLLPTASRLRAGVMASPLDHRGHIIPALTDHLEDKGGVVGPEIVCLTVKRRQPIKWGSARLA